MPLGARVTRVAPAGASRRLRNPIKPITMAKNSNQNQNTMGIVSAMRVYQHEGRFFIHLSFGRVIDSLAKNYEKIYLCVPVKDEAPDESRDYAR